MYRQRFGLKAHPLPKDARGKSFFTDFEGYRRLERGFQMLCDEPGLGLLTADPGIGKTAAVRNLAQALPRPQYLVTYLCDTGIGPVEFYRTLAVELGLKPAYRRAALWRDLKAHLAHLVDERNEHPIIIVDEAQNLPDAFLADFSAFLNFAFDSRELFTTWLVGLPAIRGRLRQKNHAALKSRIVASVHLEPICSRETFQAFIAHGLQAAGAKASLVADSARELLFRASRGSPREAGKILRNAMRIAHQREQNHIDDAVIEIAIGEQEEL